MLFCVTTRCEPLKIARSGWAEASRELAAAGDDALALLSLPMKAIRS